jgi:peptidoglycan/xylan/chitin deacetylase (PgdA/CDA1 family)
VGIVSDLRTGTARWMRMRWSAATSAPAWTILTFHEVADRARFAALLDSFAEAYELIGLDEGVRRLSSGTMKREALTLTFDDADSSVYAVAFPELQARQCSATLFVCTGFVDAGYRNVSTGRFTVMSWSQLDEWTRAGLDVGAHTVNHIPLNQATPERARVEILQSRDTLQDRLGRPVRAFAYPWGFNTPGLRTWLDESTEFDAIATTVAGDNYSGQSGKHLLRRPAPVHPGQSIRPGPSLWHVIRETHQQSIVNGVAPVMWRHDDASRA